MTIKPIHEEILVIDEDGAWLAYNNFNGEEAMAVLRGIYFDYDKFDCLKDVILCHYQNNKLIFSTKSDVKRNRVPRHM